MGGIQLQLLGKLRLQHDQQDLSLPPSRKTRALLAYLAMQPQQFRREQLCELLWEIPDDPRGSLRWSLSKLRKLVDTPGQARIIADRTQVSFDSTEVEIDARNLQTLVATDLGSLATEQLRVAVEQFSGVFLEGLDLPDFHEFYIWCIGEREAATRAQTKLLKELISRLSETPEEALIFANQLSNLAPSDEVSRVQLISLLIQLNRKNEAEQQYRMGLKMLQEAGVPDRGILYRALHGTKAAQELAPPIAAIRSAADRTLVGRDKERNFLQQHLAATCNEQSARVLLIRGEPGIGKSRLLQFVAILARKAGASILRADAYESELLRPFAVWNDSLRRALPGNPSSDLLSSSDRVSRDRVFSSLSDLMASESQERPAIILFDDMQWCDESSASALHYVLRMNRQQAVMVVAAARDVELKQNNPMTQALRDLRRDGLLHDIKLDPLSAGDLQLLIEEYAPTADARSLSQECKGNPLLALELARAQVEGGGGSSLSELVQERISRLDDNAVTLLNWAAVLAPRINILTLEQLTSMPRDAIDSALEAAEQQGILHPAERGFRFSHDLITSSIYEDITASRVQAMHRRIAEQLTVDAGRDLELAADLAHHAPRSGDPLLASQAMVLAGKLCLRFFANEEALSLYHRGMDMVAQLKEIDRICITLELSEVRIHAAPITDWKNAAEELRGLAEQALDHGALPHARMGYQQASYVRWVRGQWSDAQRDSMQGERITRGEGKDHVVGMAEASKCLALLERDLSQADAMIMEASALAARKEVNCTAIPTTLGILRYYEARFEEAREHLEEARSACKSRGDRSGEFMASEFITMVAFEAGNYAEAKVQCQSLVDLGSRLPEGSEKPFSQAMQVLINYALQDSDDGLNQALEQLRLIDAKQRLAYILNRASRIDLHRGQLESAAQRAEQALDLAQTMERPSEILQAHINLAAAGQQPKDTEEHIAAVQDLSQTTVATWARERALQMLEELEKL